MNRRAWKKSIARAITAACVSALACIIIGKGAAAMLDERVRLATERVAKRYGVECRYDAVSFVSLTGVSLSGLKLAVPGCPPFFRAADVKVLVNLRSYMTGKPYVTGIDAEEVEVIARRGADGVWDLMRLKIQKDTGTGIKTSTIAWPLSLSVEEFALTMDLIHDSATKVIDYVEGKLDAPAKKLNFNFENDDERLEINARKESAYKLEFDADSFGMGVAAPLVGRVLDMAAARISASGSIEASSAHDWMILAAGDVENVTVNHALLAREAADGVEFGFMLDAAATKGEITIHRAECRFGGETAVVTGRMKSAVKRLAAERLVAERIDAKRLITQQIAARPEFDLNVRFPHVHIDRIVQAIPRSLVPHLPDIAATGLLHGDFHISCDLANPQSLEFGFDGSLDSFAITGLGSEIQLDSIAGPFLHRAKLPDGSIKEILVGPKNKDYVPIKDVPEPLIGAILCAEDGSFYAHDGFSARHLRDAIAENIAAGRVVRGASTISMQLAKNLFLSRERTLSRKVEEAIITIAMEQRIEKKRMMEIYLNIIEWGPDVWGIGQAARYYFDKSASSLDPIECAFLASIISRPTRKWGRQPLNHIEGWWSYIRLLLTKMYRRGDVDTAVLVKAGVSDTEILALLASDSGLESLPPLPPTDESFWTSYK